jgi:hypothetical protein
MQNSSEFQYIAIDTIHESITNPRLTLATWFGPLRRFVLAHPLGR